VRQQIPDRDVTKRRSRRLQNGRKDLPVRRFLQWLSSVPGAMRALSYMTDTNRNGYARRIEGVVAVVNMNTRQVDRVIDLGVYPVPPQLGDLHEAAIGPQRIAPKPLNHVQPFGPSFAIHARKCGGRNGDSVSQCIRANASTEPSGRTDRSSSRAC
jgi:hypothetical protein